MDSRQPIEHHLLIHSRPGHETQLAVLLDRLISAAHQLPGCQAYEVRLPATSRDVWRLRGRWDDAACLEAYLALPAQQLLGEILQHHCLSLHTRIDEPLATLQPLREAS
ncbi:antibiotic biosynthesis monooxygenase family protein [Pseudomonas panipatensis]|uniref:antibiotic biosynthesis monooxygenase family protein n=1 Tax=Pseudomonas panipatensis TaxID=428992 RepID=UPI0035ADBD6C